MSKQIGNLLSLSDAARLYGISYGTLNHRRLKLAMKPAQQVAERRFYTHQQIMALLEELDGRVNVAISAEVQL